MVAAVALAILPSVGVLLYTGEWIGLGWQVVFLGLIGALVQTGATWARWGLSLWFGLTGIVVLVAGYVGLRLSLEPSVADVAPHLVVGVLYLTFATVFGASFGIGGWLDARRPR